MDLPDERIEHSLARLGKDIFICACGYREDEKMSRHHEGGATDRLLDAYNRHLNAIERESKNH